MHTTNPAVLNAVVIEPSEPDRCWLRMKLTEAGIPHSVSEYSTCIQAIEALEQCDTAPIDIVFVTIQPPLLNIAEAVCRMSSLPALTKARFAVTIADSSELARVPPGCHAILKPATAEDIQKLAQNPETGTL